MKVQVSHTGLGRELAVPELLYLTGGGTLGGHAVASFNSSSSTPSHGSSQANLSDSERVLTKTPAQHVSIPVPQDEQAERNVLGNVLMDNSGMEHLENIGLSTKHFYRESHRKIYQAMLRLWHQEIPIDLMSLTEHLRTRGELEEVGNVAYLIGVADVDTIFITTCSAMVMEKAKLREIIGITGQAMNDAYRSQPSEEVLQKLEQNLAQQTTGLGGTQAEKEKRAIAKARKYALGQAEVPTGFPTLDARIGGVPSSDLTLVGARNSHGKTMFSYSMAKNMALYQQLVQNNPHAHGFVLSCDQPASEIYAHEAAKLSGIPLDIFRQKKMDGTPAATQEQVEAYLGACDALDLSFKNLVKIRDGRVTIEDIEREFIRAVRRGATFIMLDTIQRVHFGRTKKMEGIEIVSGIMKDIAAEFDVPAIILSQVRREVDERDENVGDGRRPLKHDLSDAPGVLGSDANLMLLLYNHEKYYPTAQPESVLEVCVAKHKSGDAGSWTRHTAKLGIQKRFVHVFDGREPNSKIVPSPLLGNR